MSRDKKLNICHWADTYQRENSQLNIPNTHPIRQTEVLYVHSIFSTCAALYHIREIVKNIVVFTHLCSVAPKVVGKKQTTSAETPTWWHPEVADICKYF